MFKTKDIFIFIAVVLLGATLGTIGVFADPISNNLTYFWPAAALQAVSGLFFGWIGAIAALFFPTISNIMTDGGVAHVIGFIPSNFVQCFLPLAVWRFFKFSRTKLEKRTLIIFSIGCVFIPVFLGSILGCGALCVFYKMANMNDFLRLVKIWLIGNVPYALIFGLVLIKFLGPALKDCNLLFEEENSA
jgi:hypothetical protein